MIKDGRQIGPILYSKHPEKEDERVLSINSVCRILAVRGRIANHSLRQNQQKLIVGRRNAYKVADWSNYEEYIRTLEDLEDKTKETVLSLMLCRLEVPFDVFNNSLNYYIEQESTLSMVSKVLLQLIEEDQTTTYNHFRKQGKSLSQAETRDIKRALAKSEANVIKVAKKR